jgi:hypothetical protein
LTREELRGEREKLDEYRAWREREGRQYVKSLDAVSFEPDLSEDAMLRFKYLQAVYSLNTFYGCRIEPALYYETETERICSEIIKWGGSVVDMCQAGAEALYAALLSDAFTDKAILLKAVDRHIPF